jgi:SAM-dependent methyltransferase
MTKRHVIDLSMIGTPPQADGRLDAPAFHRNRGVIGAVLARYLVARSGDVLEIGSGTGQHAAAFAAQAPDLVWWPSDCEDAHLRSIAAWRAHAQLPNLRPPTRLDLLEPGWGLPEHAEAMPAAFLAILAVNVLHISPWRASQALIGGAAARLLPGGHLFVYGPFMRAGRHTAPSNAQFDASLRRADRAWGVRDVDDVQRLAKQSRLRLLEIAEMPANNLTLIFARA